MKIIKIKIANKIATLENADAKIICNNNDYIVQFDFDEEWDEYSEKTARFNFGKYSQDVIFSGTECKIPTIPEESTLEIGVFAGDLRSTTIVEVKCRKSILSKLGLPPDPGEDVYTQLMEKLNKAGTVKSVNGNPPDENGNVEIETGGGGGTVSWNDLTDRPFYETVETTKSDGLTWDGDGTGLYCVQDVFYKITETVPDLEVLKKGGKIILNLFDPETGMVLKTETMEFSSENVYFTEEHSFAMVSEFVIMAGEDVKEDDLEIKKGIYFVKYPNDAYEAYVQSISINEYQFTIDTSFIKKLDDKFLNGISEILGDTLTWDMEATGRSVINATELGGSEGAIFVHVSDISPTFEDLEKGGIIKIASKKAGECIEVELESGSGAWNKVEIKGVEMYAMEGILVVPPHQIAEASESGTYFLMNITETETVAVYEFQLNNYRGFPAYKFTIPYEKYIKTINGIVPDFNGNAETMKSINVTATANSAGEITCTCELIKNEISEIMKTETEYIVRVILEKDSNHYIFNHSCNCGIEKQTAYIFTNEIIENEKAKIAQLTYTVSKSAWTYTEKEIS